MDKDKAIRSAKLTLGGMLEKKRAKSAVERAQGQIAPSKYLPGVPRAVHADGGPVTSNDNFQNWFGNSVTHTDGEPHVFYTGTSKDKDFTSFNVGRHGAWFTRDPEVASSYAEQNDSQGYKRDGWNMVKTNTASRVIPAYVRAENPYTGELPPEVMRDNYKAAQSDWFDSLRAKGHDAWIPASQNGNLLVALKEPHQIKSIYNSGKFNPKQKHMNKAAGGAAMFEGVHPDLQDESGKPMDLYHGTPGPAFEAFDDAKLGARDAGFYGRGHYLTPEKDLARAYADNYPAGEAGATMGPLHAALKNPYIWDTSDAGSHRTLRDLQSMGIMKGQGKLDPWDNLQRHHIDPFMREMQTRGHDGVLVKGDSGLSEVVVFKPTAIKHRDAEVFDPNDPRIMRAEGGEVDDPVDLGTARLMRNFNENSTGPTPAAEGVFNRIEDRYQKSSMAYDAAHADGVFDSVQIGDVYKYKPLPNSSPMEVVGHRMMPVERWGGEKPPKYVYHGHYPVVDLKGGGETKPYSVERMEDRDLYDRVKGRPRIVKAGGGNVDKALAVTRSFTKDGRAATMQLKAKGD